MVLPQPLSQSYCATSTLLVFLLFEEVKLSTPLNFWKQNYQFHYRSYSLVTDKLYVHFGKIAYKIA